MGSEMCIRDRTYTADNGYGGSTEATELWLDGTNSSIGFSISGSLGADPS